MVVIIAATGGGIHGDVQAILMFNGFVCQSFNLCG